MADSHPSRNPAEPAPGRGDSQLRIVRPPVTLPEGEAEASDDSPTIISKRPPLEHAPLEHAIQAPTANVSDFAAGSNLRGRNLAHFELLEPIGVGGMAAVLRARDRQLDRLVALKILPPDMAKDPENIQRFHQEARAAAKLDHENIARVFYCGDDQHLHFIAFEFVEGENLRTLVDRRGRIPVPEAVRYMLQIAAGLDHAASRGVVHRDIKPSNIIISPNGRAKLVDMGLARNMGPQKDGLTHSGVTLGTFDYISPEQALEPRDADTRSDIYSLGCTFYHMLTGQAPVPEGTAAKKLHHHQHVPPLDPRQINPAIPDEIAAILARMMAKDPKDRYQHPVHLVQHLMQVAQKVGAADDVPTGMLFVDAPLPSAPHRRPMFVLAVALLGLGGILLILSLANPTNLPPGPLFPSGGKGRAAIDKQPDRDHPPRHVQGGAADQDLDKLQQAFAGNESKAIVQLTGNVDLGDRTLEFDHDGELIIESEDAQEPRTITMKHPGGIKAWTGLSLKKSKKITFRNVKFEVTTQGVSPRALAAIIAIADGARVTFDKCWFKQAEVKIDRRFMGDEFRKKYEPLASVALHNAEGDQLEAPHVTFKRCYFQRGQVAVAVHGVGHVTAQHCALGLHGTLVHMRGNGKDSQLAFTHCSAFVLHGPAFRLDDQARCRLTLEDSIFSCPTSWKLGEQDEPDLIRQLHLAAHAVELTSRHNVYHNLNALWVTPNEAGTATKLITDLKTIKDDTSVHLTGLMPSPWASEAPHQQQDGALAFQLNLKLLELKIGPVGVQYAAFGTLEMPAPALASKQKIVDPDASSRPPPGVFKTIDQALSFAEPGDEILIKHSMTRREVEIPPIRVKLTDVTFKPYPGQSPILTLAQTTEPEAAFFHLHDQKIVFDGLELELQVDQKFTNLSMVSIDGNGSCTFRRCVLTLKEQDKAAERVPMQVVALLKPDKSMEMGGTARPPWPNVLFQECLVRGEGDALAMKGSRAAKVRFENTLLVLDGMAVSVTGNKKEVPAADGGLMLELSKVSAFVSDSAFHIRAGTHAKGLAPSQIDAEAALFVALENKPLVAFEAEGHDLKLVDVLSWRGRKNAYSGYDALRIDPEGWRTMEMEPRYVKASYGPRPAQLSRAVPEQFRATDASGEPLPGPDAEKMPRINNTPPEPPQESD